MNILQEPFNTLADLSYLREDLKQNRETYNLSGCIDAAKPHLIYGLSSGVSFVVTFDELRARALREAYSFYNEDCYFYPSKDYLFYQSDIRGNAITRERLNAVNAIMSGRQVTIFASVDALMNRLPNPSVYEKNYLSLEMGNTVELEILNKRLINLGYDKVLSVEHPGEYAIRGGICDVFPLNEDNPIRIELWGDEVDSIRYFSASTQLSLGNIRDVKIGAATEIMLTQADINKGLDRMKSDMKQLSEEFNQNHRPEEAYNLKKLYEKAAEAIREGWGMQEIEAYLTYFCPETYSILDYLPENTTVFLDEISHIKNKAHMAEEEFFESMQRRYDKGYILPGQREMLFSYEEILGKLGGLSKLVFSTLDSVARDLDISKRYTVRLASSDTYSGRFELFAKQLDKYMKQGYKVVITSVSRTKAKRLAEDIRSYGVNASYSEDWDIAVSSGQVLVTYGSIEQGFVYPDIKWALITDTDIFGTRVKRKRKKHSYEGERISSFSELKVGDYVVHENHGVGIYRGMEKIEVDRVMKDYIKIEYAKKGNLYILASQFDMVQKYADAEGKKPKLNILGNQEWARTKSNVRSAVGQVAKELVELYALRSQDTGYVYGPDTSWQQEFEETFPYEETEGQIQAINDVKSDMMSPRIMDRLICGDVGYGKTEIAIRAAFKAVQENKQVVYLAPTTILASQHYNTFVQRMKDYPVNIELMCRFKTAAEQKKTIAGLKDGSVDIVIGTHRILSKDVEYKDLGLLIIDEEQRFGVTHKDRIKQMKKNVDVLSLSATPIPRTLHMSLIGIRELSVLEEAPMDRMPIQTFVFEYNEEMIRDAIVREMARGGQVYYVFNRVSQIADVAAFIQRLVPEAEVAYTHGRMSETKLEDVMYSFMNGEIDVLVSTTIIEIGLDIANANTMIIHDADQLGLSQLYQLRGRIGRSNRTAYAFFMYRKDKILKEVAEKRLAAIKEFSDLGSGFKIAMRDLEIRGAGNMLGQEQHGHMAAVGYDLYCKMLNEAIKLEKGQEEVLSYETCIDFDIDAYIPWEYIPDEIQKLDVYKRIANISCQEDYDAMLEELIDRFGEPKRPVMNLIFIAKLKYMAHEAYITEIKQRGTVFSISMFPQADIDPAKIPDFVKRRYPYVSFIPNAEVPKFEFDYSKNNRLNSTTAWDYLIEIIEDLSKM